MADHAKLSEALRKLVRAPENNLQIVHGFVSKYTPPSCSNGISGFIDFISMDGTIHLSDILLNSIPGLSKGQIMVPSVKSDVTILWVVGTGDASILSFSHLETYTLSATNRVSIGVTSVINDPNSDYDELKDDGNKTETIYDNLSIISKTSNKTDSATQTIQSNKIMSEVGKALVSHSKDKIEHYVGSSKQTISDNSIALDSKQIILGAGATDSAVLGNQLVSLMVKFITECSKITTPTMLGTMPIINLANFLPFLSECNSFLSKTVTVK